MIKDAVSKIVSGINLSEDEAAGAMNEIMAGTATHSQIATFITALRMKGETVDEITGCAKIMRRYSQKIVVDKGHGPVLDTCGTGGDLSGTFNISTAAAFVAAGAGVIVAKHGNKSVSSKCGSADVLEALGVNIALSPEEINDCINSIGIAFLFAPLMHTAMKNAAVPRREIGIRTIFNILGPLTNPASADAQLLGVFDAKLTEIMAKVLDNLGVKRAFVVSGLDGLDEISTVGKTQISELKERNIKNYCIEPEDFGFKKVNIKELAGGSAQQNADLILRMFKGEKGDCRDIVVLNSAAALVVAGKSETFSDGIDVANNSIDSGNALKKLEALIKFSRK